MSKWAFVNNAFVLEETACLHFRDLAVQRGYGIFDFLKTKDFIPIFLDLHLDRFFNSARHMRLPVEKTKEELQSIIAGLITKNKVADAGIRLTLTGGNSEDGYQIAQPNLIISQHLFQSPTKEQFRKGIQLVTYAHQRQLPHVKTTDYLMAIWLQPFIKEQGADDVLYHHQNSITECPRANFFIVTQHDKIITPACHILKGINRDTLLRAAKDKFEVEEREITIEEALKAKEAFITSTTKNILPVTGINGKKIGKGIAGNRTSELLNLLNTHVQPSVSDIK